MNTFQQGRHPVNIGHLVMGIAFLGLVGVWAIIQSDLVEGTDVRWLLPVPWVFAGIAGLLATTLSGGRRHAVTETGWVDTAARTPARTTPARSRGSEAWKFHWLTSETSSSHGELSVGRANFTG